MTDLDARIPAELDYRRHDADLEETLPLGPVARAADTAIEDARRRALDQAAGLVEDVSRAWPEQPLLQEAFQRLADRIRTLEEP